MLQIFMQMEHLQRKKRKKRERKKIVTQAKAVVKDAKRVITADKESARKKRRTACEVRVAVGVADF